MRELTYAQAIREALDLCLALDTHVIVMGLGVPDPKGLFGTTLGLAEKYGRERVRDMPTSENAMTGVAIGAALSGIRPILTHQRVDFALLSVEQIVNQAAKWHYMFGGKLNVPLTIRMIVGRGWGQGPQHAQNLASWFAHVPGLKVVLPATPADAKGLLIASVEDDNPVLVIEHRWCFNVRGPVPEGVSRVPLGKARILRSGNAVTIVSSSHMTLDALRAAERLAEDGIDAELVDLRTLAPLDSETLVESVTKTRRLVVAEDDTVSFGSGAEIIARIVEHAPAALAAAPVRVGFPDCPSPSSPALAAAYFPRVDQLVDAARKTLGLGAASHPTSGSPLDVPDPSFTGPF